jgi:hemolysin III
MYSAAEERLNIVSHKLGLVLSGIALALLVIHAGRNGGAWHIFSFAVFGLSLVSLYSASTWYHSTADPERRRRRRIVDHAAIYVLIAGTYTPFALITLDGAAGNTIFALVWSMAICGIGLKLFFTGQFKLLSTLIYVAMGWMIVFVIEPLRENLAPAGLSWITAGGVFYTAGAVLYAIRGIPFNHAIFHLFVLLGSFCHFIAVYRYVLPAL